jgi:hypothetical protein
MSFTSNQSPLSNVKALQATTWTVAKVDLPVAGTIYSYTFPANTKKFALLAEKAEYLHIGSSASSITGGDYWEVYQGVEFTEDHLTLASFTIYFRSDKASDVVRFQSWA